MKEQNTSDRLFRERSPQVVAMDNLIRRKLRVSDPNDPQEVADALSKLYYMDKQALERESLGFSSMAYVPTASPSADDTASSKEVEQAVGDVERDLKTLTTHSLLKDIEPELNGWASAIRTAVADGINAARQALDPRQRDLAFANRRLLGDYARVVRYVGALTPDMNIYYRRLAQSLDEVSAMILVLMGEALANIGFSGHFLLQVSMTDLQERRDAVLHSLRNLVGSVRESYDSNQWPRGLVAYRSLLERLEQRGHNDLRILLQENNLSRLMDDLIHRAGGGSALGMRALGATAQLSIDSLRRLLIVGRFLVDPESPPLSAFFSAVQLFVDAFGNEFSGTRLLYIARPAIVFYGFYGIGAIVRDTPPDRLLRLLGCRGQFASLIDCYLGCGCNIQQARCQMILDKILYDTDRAIDLYALGGGIQQNWGRPEQRAAAYVHIMDHTFVRRRCLEESPINDQIHDLLDMIGDILWRENELPPHDMVREELCMQLSAEASWQELLRTMTPSCFRLDQPSIQNICGIINEILLNLGADQNECPAYEPNIPATTETILEGLLNDRTRRGEI